MPELTGIRHREAGVSLTDGLPPVHRPIQEMIVVLSYLYFIFINRIASPNTSVTPLVRRIAQSFLITP